MRRLQLDATLEIEGAGGGIAMKKKASKREKTARAKSSSRAPRRMELEAVDEATGGLVVLKVICVCVCRWFCVCVCVCV